MDASWYRLELRAEREATHAIRHLLPGKLLYPVSQTPYLMPLNKGP